MSFNEYSAQSAPKPIANSYDIRYIPHAMRPGVVDSSPARLFNTAGESPVTTTSQRRATTTGVPIGDSFDPAPVNAPYGSLFPATIPILSFATQSSLQQQQQQQQQASARYPLQQTPGCELSQWITTTTTNSPVQHVQHLQQYAQHFQQQQQTDGLPGSASTSATSSSFPTTASSSAASSSDFSSPDIYASPVPSYSQAGQQQYVAPSSLPNHAAAAGASIGTLVGGMWPSSAPAAPSAMDLYSAMIHAHPSTVSYISHTSSSPQARSAVAPSPLEAGGFYAGFAGLGLQAQPSPEALDTVSPRDVMASTTVVDADDFGYGGSLSSVDYPVVGGGSVLSNSGGASGNLANFSPEAYYARFAAGDDFDLAGSFAGAKSAQVFQFGSSSASDSHPPSSSSPSDYSTQFALDMEDMGGSMLTVRPVHHPARPRLESLKSMGDREDTIRVSSLASAAGDDWNGPASAPAADGRFAARLRRPSLHNTFSVSALPAPSSLPVTRASPMPDSPRPGFKHEDGVFSDEDEEEGDGDDDADGDYVESSLQQQLQHVAGPHRISRRHSHTMPRPTTSKPVKRGSPYSRSRPAAGTNPSSASNARHPADANKKVKAVKWESTKPKYWIPEGFDPWWDQKSRGRGVETILHGNGGGGFDEDDPANANTDWPRDYLPNDWMEAIRGRGNPSRPFVCPAVNCGKTFQRSEHAKRHAGSLHTPDAVKVPCPYPGCEHKSTRGDNLKQHMDSHRRKKGGGSAADVFDGGATIRGPRKSVGGGARSRTSTRGRIAVKCEDDEE